MCKRRFARTPLSGRIGISALPSRDTTGRRRRDDMVALALEPLNDAFVAEARGIDLRRPIDAATAEAVEAAMDRYAVLVFRDQPLDEEQQLAFTRWFGPLDLGLKKVFRAPNRLRHEESIDISNVGLDGTVLARDSKKMFSNIANQLWHSDSSFQLPPAKYS